MNTQSHVIIGVALLGRGIPKRAWIAAACGLLPDITMLLIVLGLKLAGYPAQQIFVELYWQNWWQISNGLSHNFWLWGGLALLAVAMRERLANTAATIDRWSLVMVFAASGLLHAAIDFLSHREDAHMSLWPVTRWKFVSPVSYYDSNHYGTVFTIFEAVLGLCLGVMLFRQFQNFFVRMALVIAMTLYVVVPGYFIFMFH